MRTRPALAALLALAALACWAAGSDAAQSRLRARLRFSGNAEDGRLQESTAARRTTTNPQRVVDTRTATPTNDAREAAKAAFRECVPAAEAVGQCGLAGPEATAGCLLSKALVQEQAIARLQEYGVTLPAGGPTVRGELDWCGRGGEVVLKRTVLAVSLAPKAGSGLERLRAAFGWPGQVSLHFEMPLLAGGGSPLAVNQALAQIRVAAPAGGAHDGDAGGAYARLVEAHATLRLGEQEGGAGKKSVTAGGTLLVTPPGAPELRLAVSGALEPDGTVLLRTRTTTRWERAAGLPLTVGVGATVRVDGGAGTRRYVLCGEAAAGGEAGAVPTPPPEAAAAADAAAGGHAALCGAAPHLVVVVEPGKCHVAWARLPAAGAEELAGKWWPRTVVDSSGTSAVVVATSCAEAPIGEGTASPGSPYHGLKMPPVLGGGAGRRVRPGVNVYATVTPAAGVAQALSRVGGSPGVAQVDVHVSQDGAQGDARVYVAMNGSPAGGGAIARVEVEGGGGRTYLVVEAASTGAVKARAEVARATVTLAPGAGRQVERLAGAFGEIGWKSPLHGSGLALSGRLEVEVPLHAAKGEEPLSAANARGFVRVGDIGTVHGSVGGGGGEAPPTASVSFGGERSFLEVSLDGEGTASVSAGGTLTASLWDQSVAFEAVGSLTADMKKSGGSTGSGQQQQQQRRSAASRVGGVTVVATGAQRIDRALGLDGLRASVKARWHRSGDDGAQTLGVCGVLALPPGTAGGGQAASAEALDRAGGEVTSTDASCSWKPAGEEKGLAKVAGVMHRLNKPDKCWGGAVSTTREGIMGVLRLVDPKGRFDPAVFEPLFELQAGTLCVSNCPPALASDSGWEGLVPQVPHMTTRVQQGVNVYAEVTLGRHLAFIDEVRGSLSSGDSQPAPATKIFVEASVTMPPASVAARFRLQFPVTYRVCKDKKRDGGCDDPKKTVLTMRGFQVGGKVELSGKKAEGCVDGGVAMTLRIPKKAGGGEPDLLDLYGEGYLCAGAAKGGASFEVFAGSKGDWTEPFGIKHLTVRRLGLGVMVSPKAASAQLGVPIDTLKVIGETLMGNVRMGVKASASLVSQGNRAFEGEVFDLPLVELFRWAVRIVKKAGTPVGKVAIKQLARLDPRLAEVAREPGPEPEIGWEKPWAERFGVPEGDAEAVPAPCFELASQEARAACKAGRYPPRGAAATQAATPAAEATAPPPPPPPASTTTTTLVETGARAGDDGERKKLSDVIIKRLSVRYSPDGDINMGGGDTIAQGVGIEGEAEIWGVLASLRGALNSRNPKDGVRCGFTFDNSNGQAGRVLSEAVLRKMKEVPGPFDEMVSAVKERKGDVSSPVKVIVVHLDEVDLPKMTTPPKAHIHMEVFGETIKHDFQVASVGADFASLLKGINFEDMMGKWVGIVRAGVAAAAGAVIDAGKAGVNAAADVGKAGVGAATSVAKVGAGAVGDGAGAVADVAKDGAGAAQDVAQAGAGAAAHVFGRGADVAGAGAGAVTDAAKAIGGIFA